MGRFIALSALMVVVVACASVEAPAPTASTLPTSPASDTASNGAGVPTQIGGQPVLSTDEAWKEIGYGNGNSMLVAGVISYAPMPCPLRSGASLPPAPFGCPSGYLLGSLDSNGAYIDLWTDATSASLFDHVGSSQAVVLRVHAYDPRASACPEEGRRGCELAVVVDAVAWTSPIVEPTATPVAASSSAPASAAIPTQAGILGAVARWLPTYSYFELPPTLYVLTGASDFQIGFDSRRPAMLEAASRPAISTALGADHRVIYVDDPTPLIPSPHPDVAVSWEWGDGGALVGFSMDRTALTAEQPNVVVSVDNGDHGTDVLVTVGWDGSTWAVTTVGQPGQWVT